VRADNLATSAVGGPVASAMQATATELDGGAIVSVDPLRARVRILPFGS
jgi:hypothetical protein